MGGVVSGSPVSASNTNSAFLEKNADDATVGKVGLHNTDVASGAQFDNAQAEINGLDSFTGRTLASGPSSLPTWTNNDVGISTDTIKDRADNLTREFNPTTGIGHGHSGTAGDAPKLNYLAALNGIQLTGKGLQEPNLTGVTGTSTDVSSTFPTDVPSTADTIEGVVVNNPQNIVQIFDSSGATILDGGGNKVYGRLTNSGGVGGTWTLSYFSVVSGIETAYSFVGSNTIEWFVQQLYDETNRPVYSDLFSVNSNTVAATIPDATTSVKGKVLLATATPQPVGTASVGVGPRTAVEDHSHEGMHSLAKFGGTPLTGDVTLSPGANVTLTQVGQNIQIASTGGGGGFTPQFFQSSQVTTDGFLTSSSFTTPSNSPALMVPCTVTGTYKVYCILPIDLLSAGIAVQTRIFETSAMATLLAESQGFIYGATSRVSGTHYIQSIYTLTSGNTYQFDVQGRLFTGSGTIDISGSQASFYIFAELVG